MGSLYNVVHKEFLNTIERVREEKEKERGKEGKVGIEFRERTWDEMFQEENEKNRGKELSLGNQEEKGWKIFRVGAVAYADDIALLGDAEELYTNLPDIRREAKKKHKLVIHPK